MKKRKNNLKKVSVLLIAALLVSTTMIIIPTMIAQSFEHDVGVSEIISPPTSGALLTYPVNVTVKNYGKNAETFDVQVEILRVMEEDFSGAFPPDGWETDWWMQSNTNYAGGAPPEALCNDYTQYYNYIMTPPIDFSGVGIVLLEFKFYAYIYYSNNCDLYVKYTTDGINWVDITPWENPVLSFGPETFTIEITGDPDLGDSFQVKWEYSYIGSYNYYYLWLDDVKIKGGVYAEIVEDVTIPENVELFVDFPDWTLSGCGNGEYQLTAFTMLEGDYNLSNDSKTLDILVEVDPLEMINELIDTLADMTLPPGVKPSLNPFLNNAKGFLTPPYEDENLAIIQLNKFLLKVANKLSQGKLTGEQADLLTNDTQSIIYFLTNCYQ